MCGIYSQQRKTSNLITVNFSSSADDCWTDDDVRLCRLSGRAEPCVGPAVQSLMTSDDFRCWSIFPHAAALWIMAVILLFASTKKTLDWLEGGRGVCGFLTVDKSRPHSARIIDNSLDEEPNEVKLFWPLSEWWWFAAINYPSRHIFNLNPNSSDVFVLEPTAKATLKCSRTLQRCFSFDSESEDAFIVSASSLVHLETYTRSLTLHFSTLLSISVMETIRMYFLTKNLWRCAYVTHV